MEAVYPLTALQKKQGQVRESADKNVVRITENGHAAYIFCSEEVFMRRIEAEREDAACEALLLEAVGRSVADIDAGNYVESIDEALDMIIARSKAMGRTDA
jgi:hypothetical protein